MDPIPTHHDIDLVGGIQHDPGLPQTLLHLLQLLHPAFLDELLSRQEGRFVDLTFKLLELDFTFAMQRPE